MKTCSIIDYFSRPWFALVLILLIGFLAYSNIYQAPLVFDGVFQIEGKAKIRDLSNFLSPRVIFSPRPLVEFTFALNYKFGKLNVFGYHLVNVVIHIINGMLVYFLALDIFKLLMNPPAQQLSHSNSPKSKVQSPKSQVDPKLGTHNIEARTSEVVLDAFQSAIINHQSSIYWMSLFTALIFVAHPIQTQAVTYIVQRYTSMAAMFYLLSILFYVKGRIVAEGSKLKAQSLGKHPPSAFSFQISAYFAASLLCSILAFLSKQNTASILGVVLLVEYILFDRTWQGWKRKILWFAPIFVLMGVFILYVSGFFRGEMQLGSLLEDVSEILRVPGTDISRWIYLCTQFNVLIIYVQLLFLPVGQNLDYMYSFRAGFFDGYTPLAFLFLIAIIGVGIWNIKKRPVITLAIFWFFITVSVESSIFPISDAVFEHRLYLPMFGFAIAVAYSVFYLLPVKRYWVFVISILIVLSLGTATYFRNGIWRDRTTLWSDVVSKSTHNFRAHYNLGTALYHSGQLDKAVKSYSEALRIKSDFAVAHDNLGIALEHMGRMDDAMRHFSEALRLKPRDAKILTNYGQALMQRGNIKDAMSHFSKALKINSNNAEAHNNLGIALAQQGNLKDAVKHFSKALRTEPHNAKIHSNLGQAFMLEGKLQKAARHFSEAVRLKPEYAEAHSKLGVVLTRLRDYNGAIGHFSKALQIRPGLGEARKGLKRAFRLRSMKKRL